MSLKKLQLDREKIIDAISNFNPSFEITKENKPSMVKYRITENNEVKSLLIFYFLSDGKTTISWHECANPEYSKLIAEHIVSLCSYPEYLKTSIYIKRFTDDDLDNLLDYLQNYCGAILEGEKTIGNGKTYVLKSKYGDKAFLNYFTNKAFNVQGNIGLMKFQVIEGLSSYLTFNEIVQATLEKEDFNLNPADIEGLYVARFPISSALMHDVIKSIILPMFITQRIIIPDGFIMDLSFKVFPILRGVEGCIKQILQDYNVDSNNHIGSLFDYNGTHFVLKRSYRDSINDGRVVESLEKLYNYHKNNRHAIFHVDDTILTTKIITSEAEVIAAVNEAAELIEDCYTQVYAA
ncbi:type II toxin-antitoxin system RnlA family toxin [Sphingobacterium chungjuense]|uniref:type II toxin-antitoxin system RnlA family toxin n=1 Tax=Sphingobacterium chungjuense TaxID=2675553 RepID=UPI00140B85CA|nr:type II toxin-antitoxin system RnlA family toxin [Sphingobacterium chungjuense]